MKIAVLADVHGNLKALETVLKDCQKREIGIYILLGDLFEGENDRENIFQNIRRLAVVANIHGDTEEALYQKKEKRSAADMHQIHNSTDFIESMTEKSLLKAGNQYIYMTHHLEEERMPKTADIVLYAHTHVPEIKNRGKVQYWNPGSVGKTEGYENRACYGIIDIDPVERVPKFEPIHLEIKDTCVANLEA